MQKINFFLSMYLLAGSVLVSGQENKPCLTPKDYEVWQSLLETGISDDGNWVSYRVGAVDRDDTLYIVNPSTQKNYKYPNASRMSFSGDSKWAAFRVGYSKKSLEKMQEKNEEVRYKLKLLELETGKEMEMEEINQFEFAENGLHLAMVSYPLRGSKQKSSDLIVRNLITGKERNIGNVSEWSFNKHGDLLAYIIDANGNRGNSVDLFNLNTYHHHSLFSDTTDFVKLTWNKDGKALAFLQPYYDSSRVGCSHRIYAFDDINRPATMKLFNPSGEPAFPDSVKIKEGYSPIWADDRSCLFFGTDQWVLKPQKNSTDKKGDKEKSLEGLKTKLPGVDVWHWKDDPVQPAQERRYTSDRNAAWICVFDIKDGGYRKLTSEEIKDAQITGDQRHVLAWDKRRYQPQFRLELADYYLLEVKSGSMKNVLKSFPRAEMEGSSPAGKYLLYFLDNHWWTYDIANDRHINLTVRIPVPFQDIRYDGPREEIPPFGTGGWFKEDREVLLYDEFDVWAVKPDGSGFRKLTKGRENGVISRLLRLDHEEPWIDPEQDLYFNIFGDRTKKSGFMRITAKGKTEQLLFTDHSYRRLARSKKADRFIYSAESYTQSPDLYYTDGKFTRPARITRTNAQQDSFAWGKTELVTYTSREGKELQGVLHYPARYEEGKTYPMIVYIYELRSNSLHNYIVPSPRSAYNITHFSQQGYFCFQPDIVYRTNHPGESAADCVIPAVEKVLETGMIDRNRIGLMGHSWGAYQTSFIITQTDLFSAAVAGAPLTNMISMYNSIYWNSGTPDQQIFETSQGRLREPYWELMEEYLANSPLFQAKNIQTPLLMAFGDEDGAVDWNQGVEFYITLRRMKKPVIMLVYEGENHSLAKKENQEDYARKVHEFFEHHLLEKPAPPWIEKGVPYVEKKEAEELNKL